MLRAVPKQDLIRSDVMEPCQRRQQRGVLPIGIGIGARHLARGRVNRTATRPQHARVLREVDKRSLGHGAQLLPELDSVSI
jgi:hypothetical protein